MKENASKQKKRYTSNNLVMDQGNDQSRHMKNNRNLNMNLNRSTDMRMIYSKRVKGYGSGEEHQKDDKVID